MQATSPPADDSTAVASVGEAEDGSRSVADPPAGDAGERGIEIIEEPPCRRAVLVGVNNFQDLPPLRFCVQDMCVLREVLVEQGGYAAENVVLLTQDVADSNGAPLRDAVIQALETVCDDAGRNDTILFAFAGHGMEVDGAGFLMPEDGVAEDPVGSAVPMSEIRGLLSACVAESKFLIVDACHSGGTRDVGLNQERLLEPGTGVFGLFSCQANQKSYEDEDLGHGVFTYYLAEALRGGADLPDANGAVDNQVTIDEAYRYLIAKVESHTIAGRSIDQTPFRHFEGSGEPVLTAYTVAPVSPDVEMLTLPGLTGQWWFKETPWLLPDIRLELARIQRRESARLLPDGSTLAASDGLRSSDIESVHQELHTDFDFVLSRINNNRRKTVLELIADWRDSPPSEATREQVLSLLKEEDSLYSLAIVQHYLGLPEAGQTFEAAVEQQEANPDMPKALHARLLADYGQFLLETDRPEMAHLQFQHALLGVAGPHEAPLFSIECELGRASCLRQLTRWDEAERALQKALSIAEEHLPSDHPMKAFILKSFGWLYMDQWRLGEAGAAFDGSDAVILAHGNDAKALEIRDRVFLMHNSHGRAMAARYSGNRDLAFELYDDLIIDIIDVLEKVERTSDRSPIVERLVNTDERVADMFLFAARGSDTEAAELMLMDAMSGLADLSGTVATTTRARLECKLALASALADDQEAALEHLAAFDEFAVSLSEESVQRLNVYRQAAEGLAMLSQASTRDEGTTLLAELLANAQDSDVREQYRRDEFDVLLLVGTRLVLASAGQTPLAAIQDNLGTLIDVLPAEILQDTAQAGADSVIGAGNQLIDDAESRTKSLFANLGLLFGALPGEYRQGDAFRYLRDYYDVALTVAFATCEKVPVESRTLLAVAKTGISTLRGTRPTEPLLIFYVPQGADSGWAILFPQRKVFAFDVPTEGGSELPDELQQAIAELPSVQVHWSDAIHGWTEEDFPFVVPNAKPAD